MTVQIQGGADYKNLDSEEGADDGKENQINGIVMKVIQGGADVKNLDSEEAADDGEGKEEGAVCERSCNRCFLFASILAGVSEIVFT